MTNEPDPSTPWPNLDSGDPMARQGRRCTARARSTGNQCRQLAMDGSTVCYAHGGRAPQVRAAAERNLVTAKAARALQRLDITDPGPVGNPVEELGRIVAKAVRLVDLLAEQAADLPPELVTGSPQFGALERAIDRAGKLLVDTNRLGIEGRRLAIDADTAAVLNRALEEAVTAAGGDPVTAHRVLTARITAAAEEDA